MTKEKNNTNTIVYISEPSYVNNIGHYTAYANALCRHIQDIGLNTTIWGNRAVTNCDTRLDRMAPVYTRDCWGKKIKTGKIITTLNIIQTRLERNPELKIIFKALYSLGRKVITKITSLTKNPIKKIKSWSNGCWEKIKNFFKENSELKLIFKAVYSLIIKIIKFLLSKVKITSNESSLGKNLKVKLLLLRTFLKMTRVINVLRENNASLILLTPIMYCLNSHFRETISQIHKEKIKKDDVIFCSSITGHNFFSWAVLATYCSQKKIRVVLLFRYQIPWLTYKRNRIITKIAKNLYYHIVANGYVRYFSDSPLLAQSYSTFLLSPVQVFGNPCLQKLKPYANHAEEKQILNVAVVGNPRVEKGFDKIVEAIELLQEKPERGVFSFHIQTHNSEKGLQTYIERLQDPAHSISITLYQYPLNYEKYINFLQKQDIILLPYDKDIYKERTSGPLFEAIALAKVAVVTSDTWLSYELKNYGNGVIIPNSTPEEILQGLFTAYQNYSEYQKSTLTKAKRYQKLHALGNILSHIGNQLNKTPEKVLLIYPFTNFYEQAAGNAMNVFLRCLHLHKKGFHISMILPLQKPQRIPPDRLRFINFFEYEINTSDAILPSTRELMQTIRSLLPPSEQDSIYHLSEENSQKENEDFQRTLLQAVSDDTIIMQEYAFNLSSALRIAHIYKLHTILTLHDLLSRKSDSIFSKELLKMETSAAVKADAVVVLAEGERRFLEEKGIQSNFIPPPTDINKVISKSKQKSNNYGASKKYNTPFILFVGSVHFPNVDATERLKKIVIQQKMIKKNIEVIVAGSCHEKIERDHFINFTALGVITPDELDDLYRNCLCFVAPLSDGTGTSVKTVEAMSYSKVVLGTHDAFRGINVTHGKDCIIEDNIEKYPDLIIDLLHSPSSRKKMEQEAFSFAKTRDYNVIHQRYVDLIEKLSSA